MIALYVRFFVIPLDVCGIWLKFTDALVIETSVFCTTDVLFSQSSSAFNYTRACSIVWIVYRSSISGTQFRKDSRCAMC